MAHFDTTAQNQSSVAAAIAAPFRAVWTFLIAIAGATSRAKQVDALSALSDADLDRRGLQREDIVRHVFGDRIGF